MMRLNRAVGAVPPRAILSQAGQLQSESDWGSELRQTQGTERFLRPYLHRKRSGSWRGFWLVVGMILLGPLNGCAASPVAQTGVVACVKLGLRQRPMASSPLIGWLEEGSVVRLLKITHSYRSPVSGRVIPAWAQVQRAGLSPGYVVATCLNVIGGGTNPVNVKRATGWFDEMVVRSKRISDDEDGWMARFLQEGGLREDEGPAR